MRVPREVVPSTATRHCNPALQPGNNCNPALQPGTAAACVPKLQAHAREVIAHHT